MPFFHLMKKQIGVHNLVDVGRLDTDDIFIDSGVSCWLMELIKYKNFDIYSFTFIFLYIQKLIQFFPKN